MVENPMLVLPSSFFKPVNCFIPQDAYYKLYIKLFQGELGFQFTISKTEADGNSLGCGVGRLKG